MSFIPSRDLAQLHTRGKRGIHASITEIQKGLNGIERALGTSEDEEEHIYISREGSRARNQEEVYEGEDDEMIESKEESFELGFVKDWLMSVSCLRWIPISGSEENKIEDDDVDHQDAIEDILRRAARLIAICAGKSASGRSRRVYHFACGEGSQEISIKVQEEVLIDDALGSRTWGSAPLLVSHLLQNHLSRHLASSRESFQVLELGAGTGLVGLAISQYIRDFAKKKARVYLTDFHPDVLLNLKGNVNLNGWANSGEGEDGVRVEVSHLDWNDTRASKLTGRFDMIVAADCVYEAEHAYLIKEMAERYLKQPQQDNLSTPPQLFLCCPLRPTHHKEIQRLEQVFTTKGVDSPGMQITHQQDLVGWDDFGPPTIRLPSISSGQKGQEICFRLYIIQR